MSQRKYRWLDAVVAKAGWTMFSILLVISLTMIVVPAYMMATD